MSEPIIIDVISDVVCPWCFLGKRRLEAAIGREGGVALRWRPFQLDPTIPPGGLDRGEYMRAKFRDEARLAEAHAQLKRLGAEVGVAFDFEAIRRAPNTLDAHRLVRLADETGHAHMMVERLFSDYFEQGRDIGDIEVLMEAARACGLDADALRMRLAAGEGADEVRQEIETAQRIGVRGVPFFIFAGQFSVNGAQSVEAFSQALAQARQAA